MADNKLLYDDGVLAYRKLKNIVIKSTIANNDYVICADNIKKRPFLIEKNKIGGGVGSSTFIDLTDTPNSYPSPVAQNTMLVMNQAGDGLEFDNQLYRVDTDFVNVMNNMRFDKADVPEAIGMALGINDNGLLQLLPLGDNYTEWTDSDNTNFPVPATATEILSLTVDQDVASGEGTVSFIGSLDNYATDTGFLVLQLSINSVVVDTESIRVNSLETAKFIGISRPFDCSAGDVVSVSVYFTGPVNLTLRGDNVATTLRVKKLIVNRMVWVQAKPSTPTSSGTKGDMYCDEPNNYMYLCIDTDKWIRWQTNNSW